MKELIISVQEAGQRFDKYLVKRLPNASKSFLYKMLRKKNITLNGKKSDGSEKISTGDIVCIFFSDETYERFSGGMKEAVLQKSAAMPGLVPLKVLFENEHILVVDKPSGLLSQKARKEDISLVEQVHAYLQGSGAALNGGQTTFRAGICNRLDRNTSGIVVAGKTILGTQHMTEAFRERSIYKYYLCLVRGRISERARVSGFLYKDRRNNKAVVYSKDNGHLPSEALPIDTEYIPVCGNENLTLLKVHLITGRSHQIRAHLSAMGHPVLGDEKYGVRSVNEYYRRQYHISSQLLHAYELKLGPDMQIGLPDGLDIRTELPPEFVMVIRGEQLWEPGIPEALEALH